MLSFLYLLGLHISFGYDIYSTSSFGFPYAWVMFWHYSESGKSNMGAIGAIEDKAWVKLTQDQIFLFRRKIGAKNERGGRLSIFFSLYIFFLLFLRG